MRLGIRIRCHSSTTSSMIIRNMSHHGSRTVSTLLFVQAQQQQRVPSVRTRTTSFSSSSSSTSSYRKKSNYHTNNTQPPQSSSRHIPMWNGKPIPFHINDLQHLPSSSSSLSLLHHQQYQHYYGNNISSSSSSSSTSLQSLDDDDVTESMRSDDNDEEDKNHHSSSSSDNQNDDNDRLIVVLDLDECLIHSHFSDSSMDAALFTHQLQQQQQHRMKQSAPQLSLDSFRIVLPNHNENNPLPSHFSHRNDYYQQQLPQYNSNSNHNTHVHVFIRPGCLEFLAKVTQLYPTYIYTAARSMYANPILDHLSHAVRTLQQQQSPLDTSTATSTTSTTTKTANTTATTTTTKKCIFQGRFYREHCIYDLKTNQYYKDLTQLHRHNRYCTISSQTHKMVLIDNNPISLMKNPHNGILVDSFYGPFTSIPSTPISSSTTNVVDPTFTNVFQLLQELSILPDVRPKIAANQKLQQEQLQPSNTDIVSTTTTTTNTSNTTSATSAITTTTTLTKKASVMTEDIPSAISYIHI